MDRAAVVVQSVWRGRMVRVRAGKMLVEMRARIAAAKAAVQEHMKLGNRTRAALDALLSSTSCGCLYQSHQFVGFGDDGKSSAI